MLTTKDNPWDPWLHWDNWLAMDRALGYYTNELLARVMQASYGLSDEDEETLEARAIDEILTNDMTGMYQLVSNPDPNDE